MQEGALRARVDALLARVDLVSLIGAAVPLSRGRNPRGKCPFHGSKSDSLAVYPESGRFRCWGCGEGGDAITFVELHFGLNFIQALEQLESQHGVDGLAANPVKREKRVFRRSGGRDPISSAEMGRILWDEAAADPVSILKYLEARGVPRDMAASAADCSSLRFHPEAPISAWVEGARGRVPTAPAMLARVRTIPGGELQAVHATFLAPDCSGKMQRLDGRGEPMPARKFLGSVGGGAVMFGDIAEPCVARPLFVAEGIETLLSGMAMLDAPAEAVGLAVLSLDNLQGGWLGVGKRHSLPLFDPQPDPARKPVCFLHDGPVIGLIDADMKPLPSQRVIEHPGLPMQQRTLSSAERSQLCAALFARAWRNAGCRRVQTLRPPMGHDFNDLAAKRHAGGSFRVPA